MAEQIKPGVKQTFGIFAPILGLKQDFPVILLGKTFTSDNQRSHIQYGEIHRAKLAIDTLLNSEEVKVQTLDGFPILHYHRFVRESDAKEYLLAFTKAHIYYWNETTKTFGLAIFTCGSNCTEWHTRTFNNKVIATNNVDLVQVWNPSGIIETISLGSGGTGYTALDVITIVQEGGSLGTVTVNTVDGAGVILTCTLLAKGSGYSVANGLAVTGGTGSDATINILLVDVFAPLDTASGINYGTVEDPEYLTKAKYVEVYENYLFLGYTYEAGTSLPQNVRWSDLLDEADWKTGDAGGATIGSRDFITGLIKYKGFLIIFKQESVHQMWLTEASADIFNNKPLFTNLGCKASHSIVMDDKENLYFFASDNTFRHLLYGEISQTIDPIVKGIKSSLVDGIKSTFIEEYGQIWWAIPYGECSANNKIIKYKQVWNQEDTAINAFGDYIKESDALFLADLGADTSGYTKKLHDSEAGSNASYFVLSTDLTDKKGLSYYKRLEDLYIYVKKESSGTLTIEIKRDNETTWQSIGTIDLTGSEDILIQHLAPDIRGKTFLIKVSSNDHYRFLGMLFKFLIVGER